jgi:hypothetical protein
MSQPMVSSSVNPLPELKLDQTVTPPVLRAVVAGQTGAADAKASFEHHSTAEARLSLAGAGSDHPAISELYARFQVDPTTNILSVSIVNPTTNEVIRQIPSEEVIALARQLQEQSRRFGNPFAPGLPATTGGDIVDRKV